MLNGFFGARQGTNLLPLEVLSRAYYDQHDLPYPFKSAVPVPHHGALLLDNTPYGQDVVYQVVNDAPDFSPSGDGGGKTGKIGGIYTYDNFIKPDISKRYRFSIFVKVNHHGKNDASNSTYIGTNGAMQGTTNFLNGVVDSATGLEQINPYFISRGTAGLPQDEWMLLCGYINPVGTIKDQSLHEGGLFKLDGTPLNPSSGNYPKEYSFKATTQSLLFRAFSHYGTRSGVEQRFYHPRIDICDGTEPTIQELLIRKFG